MMIPRPTRRIPGRTYRNYQKYKRWLRDDFSFRCGYCAVHENQHGGLWHFHVDHFRPKSRPEFKHLATEYSNLLYLCDQCNVYKGNSWPSSDPLTDGIGWLDPCDHDLTAHYYYGYVGPKYDLIVLTPVGRWMATTLNLDVPARVARRRCLAEEERVDDQIAKMLEEYLAKLVRESELNVTQAQAQEMNRVRQVLMELQGKIRNRYTSVPYQASVPRRRSTSSSVTTTSKPTSRPKLRSKAFPAEAVPTGTGT